MTLPSSESAYCKSPAKILNYPLNCTKSSTVRKIAIITSGGDAPGMNAAVRSVVRMAIVRGCEPYGVYEGYQGLVEGGEKIKLLSWNDVQGILQCGGTIIGTARCSEFRERSGRLLAVKHLVEKGIDSLVVIGGDGSLTGADLLRSEWTSLLNELVATGVISDASANKHAHLSIVGMVGSIDNDMAMTDLTIGAISSLHRICESVDCISSTATSHQRAFIIEVMGRHCGWLALMAAISTGADWLFIPENPPKENWEEEMFRQLKSHRDMGKRKSIIIVAEGAIDTNLNPIKAEGIKDLLNKKYQFDARVTTLGHVQRGGSPAAIDRIIGTLQGVEAIEAILRDNPESEALLIGVVENTMKTVPLMEAVKRTKEINHAINEKRFEDAAKGRNPEFSSAISAYFESSYKKMDPLPPNKRLRIAIIHTGAPAGGMNIATRTLVRTALNRGHTPLAIHNGFKGLIAGDISPIHWMDVESWCTEGGSRLGTNRSQPSEDLSLCAYQLQQHNVDALVIIGGFEAFTALMELYQGRQNFISFCIPLILIPATISNNVPGTEASLGSDTALNVIIQSCDFIRQSAYSSRKRVFVVEVQGGASGYLACLSGLATGASCAYIPEEGLNLDLLSKDIEYFKRMYSGEANEGRVILRNETVSKTYTTEVISSILAEEGNGTFDSRTAILGHIQQGGSPSPFDRVRAVRFAVKAMHKIEDLAFNSIEEHMDHVRTGRSTKYQNSISEDAKPNDETIVDLVSNGIYLKGPDSALVVGIKGGSVVFESLNNLIPETDFKNRKPKMANWIDLNQLIRILARREDSYEKGIKDLK